MALTYDINLSTTPQQAMLRLADSLRLRIEKGELRPGSKVPSIRELARQTQLSYSVASAALKALEEEGLIEMRNRSGAFVRPRYGTTSFPPPARERQTGTRRIGVVSCTMGASPHHFVVGGILHGITEQAARGRHRVEILPVLEDEATHYEFADRILESGVDGLVWIQPIHHNLVALARLMQAGIPLVVTGRAYAEIPVPCVHMDMDAFGELVAGHLVEQNRTDLICLMGRREDLYSRWQVEALRAALQKRGIELPDRNILTAYIGSADELFYSVDWNRIIAQFLDEHPGFDAVYSIYREALGPLVALHESGRWCCPENFDLIHLGQSARPVRDTWPQIPITLVDTPVEAIGRQSVKELETLWGVRDAGALGENLAPSIEIAPQLQLGGR